MDCPPSLMRRYEDAPISLADACLVRLSELHSDCQVFTLGRGFPTLSPAWAAGHSAGRTWMKTGKLWFDLFQWQ